MTGQRTASASPHKHRVFRQAVTVDGINYDTGAYQQHSTLVGTSRLPGVVETPLGTTPKSTTTPEPVGTHAFAVPAVFGNPE
jgi:hypothetical protein